jgi:putative copper export protein
VGNLDPTLVSLWIHVPLVTAWIGLAMLDLLAVCAPGLTSEQRGRILTWSRPFTIGAIIVIMFTGVWQTVFNPVREVTSYAELSNLRSTTTYGHALFWKHGFVMVTFALTVIARFWLAPRLLEVGTTGGGSRQQAGAERTLFWVTSLNMAACVGALVLATRMIWTLH